ncbi:MAG: hypothetical protein HY805_10720, partial [Nitrospirae bacterium]|nr:hypothetical protein [Nitrospirota bacterium]
EILKQEYGIIRNQNGTKRNYNEGRIFKNQWVMRHPPLPSKVNLGRERENERLNTHKDDKTIELKEKTDEFTVKE